ncbi:unnamed protein product [Clonostachys rhizophaga]|uniref:DNA polymerase kappa n=1 Tax=Clonostachys rhizophaga TaxID=160324 RepID=A0A9N9VPW5_9HYPO|nr:unnamed protein product [Clonostachys rhizophaga]
MASSAGSNQAIKPDSTLFKSFVGVAAIKKGYEGVDRDKIARTVYEASKDSLYFNHQQKRDQALTEKCNALIEKKRLLEDSDTTSQLVHADKVVARLKDNRDLSQSIVHIDCDAFYASVEQNDCPELKDVPFAVGDTVVAACNYIARKTGCRAGMVIAVAKKMCPSLRIVKPNHDRYREVMAQICKLMQKYDPGYEICGTDEAYLNITKYCTEFDIKPWDVVESLRKDIRHETGIAVAAGIAANIQLAKISSTFIKPDGQYQLPSEPDIMMAFIKDLPVRKVTGVGHTLDRQLASIGVATCEDIFSHRQFLRDLFGDRLFEFLLEVYLGCGRTELQATLDQQQKSASIERTFKETSAPDIIERNLRTVCEAVEAKLKELNRAGQTLTVKVKMNDFESYSKQTKLPKALSGARDIFQHSLPFVKATLASKPNQPCRLLGVRLTQLVSKDYTLSAAFQRMADKSTHSKPDSLLGAKEKELSSPAGKRKMGGNLERRELSPRKKKSNLASERPEVNPLEPSRCPSEMVRCPICDQDQPPDNVSFNQHLDICLSLSEIQKYS